MGPTLNAALMIPAGDRATLAHVRLTRDDADEIAAMLRALRMTQHLPIMSSWPSRDIEVDKATMAELTVDTSEASSVDGHRVSKDAATAVYTLKRLIANSTPRSRLFVGLR